MSKTTVVYHSADFDGLFCREIARKFIPDAELIGWDFGDEPMSIPNEGQIYIMDLPVDRVFGYDFSKRTAPPGPATSQDEVLSRVIWIDHHKSSIESHPTDIPGYRIDGVAACRLAWQWFNKGREGYAINVPTMKETYIDRKVTEPLAVRLAGEYDIWDKRDPNAELFQHGLRSQELTDDDWVELLDPTWNVVPTLGTRLLQQGKALQYATIKENESIIKAAGFDVEFQGLKFLACNHARFNSFLFTAGIRPEHDALLGFCWDGKQWKISLYHAPGKEHHDLSLIAVRHGGGGHKGACGFVCSKLPFDLV